MKQTLIFAGIGAVLVVGMSGLGCTATSSDGEDTSSVSSRMTPGDGDGTPEAPPESDSPPTGDTPPGEGTPPPEGGCFVTGIGHIGADENGNGISDRPGAGRANQDSYGGNAMGMKDGSVRGQWQNTTHLADGKHVFHGQATFLHCWNDGGPGPDVPRTYPNRAIWGGPGKWDHKDGYLFIVSAADYKEGKDGNDANIRDAYAITVYEDLDKNGIATSTDKIVYQETDCVYGNFQIHKSNAGHPYVSKPVTDEMNRISSTQDLCPNSNW